jgi:multiple sugar transport system permease protein
MSITAQRPIPALPLEKARPAKRRRSLSETRNSFALTMLAVVLVAGFLSPLLRSFALSFQTPEQISQVGAPLWPASPQTYDFQGKKYSVYKVPIDGAVRDMALVKKGRTESQLVDPANPGAGPVTWQGSWRTLDPALTFAPTFDNYTDVWRLLNYPRLLFNTAAIAIIGLIGTVVSCTLVAYGFARFRFPGRGILFLILISTIFLPTAVTLIPTYNIFLRLGWVGTWLPLLVPAFFANAYDVFLLRQYMLTIPREMDEAAAIDGASPLRTLISVIVPQAWPVIIAVGIFHLVYSWNDFFGPLIYLSTKPELQTLAVGLAQFSANRSAQEPGLIQAGTLLTLIVPVILFLIFQRVFMRGVVITGVEK